MKVLLTIHLSKTDAYRFLSKLLAVSVCVCVSSYFNLMYNNLASKETNLNRIFELPEYINTFFHFNTLSKHTIRSEAF